MNGLERIGGWALLLGGLIYLGELVIAPLRRVDGFGRTLVTVGAGAWIVGQLV